MSMQRLGLMTSEEYATTLAVALRLELQYHEFHYHQQVAICPPRIMETFTPVHIVAISFVESAVTFYVFPNLLPALSLGGLFLFYSAINWGIKAAQKLIVYPYFQSPLRHLPQPLCGFYPILGHGLLMFKTPPGGEILNIMKTTANDGMIYFRGIFHEDRLILTGPAALADVLVHKSYDFEKPGWVRQFLVRFLGNGLLTSEGDEHKHQRKQIMPAFNFRHIKELYPVLWSKSIEFCDVLKRELLEKPDKVLELNHFSTQVTMDIIGLAGLGRDIGSLRNSDDLLIETYEEILEPTAEKGLYFILHLVFPAWFIKAMPWKLNERVRITTSELKRICTEFVRDKKARMKTESQHQVDILSIMMRSNTFSDEGLVDQLLTFLAAGHETTSAALTWTGYLLSSNPAIQRKLRAEVHESIPSPSALSSNPDIASVLEALPYLNAVCNETLRLYPTIPASSRCAIRDTTIDSQFIPKGTMVLVTPWAINRNPKLWGPDAEVFKPERWIDPESGRANNVGGADSNYSFLTFLHGPRSCIGEKFARAEMRALVAAFCGSFEMEMADPNEIVRPGGTITSKPINGMKLRLKPVEWGS
ncbi:cytochrome P450 3A4 [Amniculicola lignicola CBS 123094]|uniref:Cytochrome P450 3A4 n=1 Tax=Amniculicola lignicola CBS 123094 TaxID=1392246 RepID=A0A6A5W7Y6_9PLEO|nr:cytochrome P450 3A4 [Amniculicola lignicola CBS 123094]